MKIPLRILVGELETGTLPQNWEDMAQQWETVTTEWEDVLIGSTIDENDGVLDMFKDESVTIKQSVKDMKDPKKLFTDFSRMFSVPATKKNNRIFKHYYNIDIVDGLDSRALMPCKLYLGNSVYKDGNLTVESVKMYRGKPMQWNLRFVGLLSELAKKFGSQELTEIGLEQYNIENYNPKTEFTTPAMDTLTFPLASKSGRYLIHSSDSQIVSNLGLENAKNIRYTSSTRQDGIYGLISDDIVGALRVGKILDNIESTYNLDFTGCFTRNYIRDLYLWLHKPDKERDGEPITRATQNLTWSPTPVQMTGASVTAGSVVIGQVFSSVSFEIRAKATFTGDGKVIIKKNGTAVAEQETSNQWTNTLLLEYGTGSEGVYTFDFQYPEGSTSSVVFTVEVSQNNLFLPFGEIVQEPLSTDTYTGTESFTLGSTTGYQINENLPQMKVIDFLTSLFKMFNIIATVTKEYDVNNDEYIQIHTEHFDRFMSRGVEKDFTKYIDNREHIVRKPNLFSALRFSFSKVKTAMEQGFLKVNGRPYGELTYQVLSAEGDRLIGDEYKMEVKNQRIPLERLYNLLDNSVTPVVYTQFGDLKGSEQTTDPKFTYVATVTGGTGLAWDNGAVVSQVSNYCLPSNIYAGGDTPSSVLDAQELGLYFGEELNEHAVNKSITGLGLVNNFYRGLLSMLFDEDKRRVTMQGEITMGQLVNLKMSDVLKIGNDFYNINSIDTNYLTGMSNLELTLVGRSKLEYFQLLTRRIQNTNGAGGADLRVTYLNHNGFIDSDTIAGGAFLDIDCIGKIASFSHSNYTDTIQ